MKIDLSLSDGVEQTDEGWILGVTVYGDPDEAREDQTIGGSRWEIPGDMNVAYAGLILTGPGQYTDTDMDQALDSLIAELESEGYEVTEIP